MIHDILHFSYKLPKKTATYDAFKTDFLNKLKSDCCKNGYPMYNPELNLLVRLRSFGQDPSFIEISDIKPPDLERKIRSHYYHHENVLEIYKVRNKTFSVEQFENEILPHLEHNSWENAYFWYQKNCCKIFEENKNNNVCLTNKDIKSMSKEDLSNVFNQGFYTVRFESPNRTGCILTADKVLDVIKTDVPAIIMSSTEEDVYFYNWKFEKDFGFSIIHPVEVSGHYDMADLDWNLDTVQTKIQELAKELEESDKRYPTIQIKYLLTNLLVNRDKDDESRLPVWLKDLKIPKQLEDIVDSIFLINKKNLPDLFCWKEQTKKINDFDIDLD